MRRYLIGFNSIAKLNQSVLTILEYLHHATTKYHSIDFSQSDYRNRNVYKYLTTWFSMKKS